MLRQLSVNGKAMLKSGSASEQKWTAGRAKISRPYIKRSEQSFAILPFYCFAAEDLPWSIAFA